MKLLLLALLAAAPLVGLVPAASADHVTCGVVPCCHGVDCLPRIKYVEQPLQKLCETARCYVEPLP